MGEERGRERLGTTIRGKYRVDALIGAGGMAVVYAVTHRNNKRFAMKMLHPELSHVESIRARFLREGYVANTVDHPGSVAVVDDDLAEDGAAYLVMELLEGITVEEAWEKAEHKLALDVTMDVAQQTLDVLVAAHAKGIVHRDLKPANLFLTKEGRVKVLDFGIARLRQSESGIAATQSGVMMGTPAFMPPEQALGKTNEIDARTDIWAIGATIFTLASGHYVHEADNAPQMLVAAATRPARSLSELVPDAPQPLVDIVAKALALRREDRFQTAGDMRDALAAIAGGSPSMANTKVRSFVSTMMSAPPNAAPADAFAATATPVSMPQPSIGNTAKPVSSTNPEATAEARSGKRWIPYAAAAAIALFGGGVFAIRSKNQVSADHIQAPPPPSSASEPHPQATATQQVSAVTPTISATTVAPTATALTAAASAHAQHAKTPSAPVQPATSSAPMPKPNCDPPYTVDSTGKRSYKPECL